MTIELLPLPDHRDRVILCGTSVRKSLPVLQAFLTSLAYQELPARTRLQFCFVGDFTAEQADAEAYLRDWLKERGGELLRGVPSAVGDFRDVGSPSHDWSLSAMRRVGANKDKIIQRALQLKVDALWLVDADLILDRTTLASLIACERPVTCGVYWTRWSKPMGETQTIWASPQVWLLHPYGLGGRGMEEWEFRGKLVRRELTQVWGQGANTLIDRKVLEAGINFAPAPDFSQVGLNAGEDRQFCVKAERAHLPMFADPWPDCFHVYHAPEDVAQIPAMLARLGTPHPEKAQLGDWISVKLHPLEPLPTPRGWQHIAPYSARGRFGTLAMLPELEEAIFGMTRGQSVTVRVHCPISHPLPYFRGRARLYRVTLVDCKPWSAPPVLEQDLFLKPQSGRILDKIELSPQLQAGVLEGTFNGSP